MLKSPVKFNLWLVLIPCLSGLTGCWDRQEINDLGISIAASIDIAQDQKVRFTQQVYVPSGSSTASSTGGTPTGNPGYFVFTGTGLSIRDAHQNLQNKMSRRLFIAHRNLYLISETIARNGISDYLDELARFPQSRLRTSVMITRGDADSYLMVSYPFEQVPSAALRKLLYSEPVSNYIVDLKEVIRIMSKSKHEQNILIPIIGLKPTSPGAAGKFDLNGWAVMQNGRMVGELTNNEARGALWLKEEIKRSTVTVTISGQQGQVSCQLLRTKNDFNVKMINGHPTFHVWIRPEADIMENDTTLDLNNPKNLAKVELAFSSSIHNRIEQALNKLQRQYKTDVLEFSARVNRAFPKEWQTLSKNWSEEFSGMPVEVEVDGKIRRSGMTGAPLPRKQSEIQ